MAANNYQNIKIGIDIGTSKVVCLIAESSPDGINVIGLGSHPSKGPWTAKQSILSPQ